MLVSPFAPHTAEELWEAYGHAGGLAAARWPVVDEAAARAESIVVPVQVNGKVRGRLTVAPDATAERTGAAGVGRSGSAAVPGGQDGQEGGGGAWAGWSRWWWDDKAGTGARGRGPGAALTRRQVLRLLRSLAASLALRAAATRSPAAARSCPTTCSAIGVPMFGNRTPYSPLEQVFTEKVRIEFQSRALPGAADRYRRRCGRPRRHHQRRRRAGRLQPEPAGLPLPLHRDGQRVARRRARSRRRCGRTRR